jgi:ABC-2 type transport system permease protein
VNQLANLGKMFSKQINKIYPLSWLSTKGVVEMSLYHFVLYLGISLGWYYLFVKVISTQYKMLNTSLMTYQAKSNYKLRELKVQAPIYALYKKEMKRFFSSTIYVLNLGFGVVMMIASAIVCFIMGPEKLEQFMQVEGMLPIFNKIIPFAMSVMLTMTCTTSVSLSLEGKNLWIIKSAPVQEITIFHSKILVNLTLLLPAAVVSSLLIAIRFPMDVISFLLLMIVPIVYSFFTSIWGMYINIKMPNYEWVSETAVIKQGLASIIGMLGSAVFAAVPMGILFVFHQIDYRIIQTACMVLMIGFTTLLYHKIRKSRI